MTFLIGERNRRLLEHGMHANGAEVIWTPDNPDLDDRLAGHIDLSVVFPEPSVAVVAGGVYPYIVNKLTNRGCEVLRSSPQGADYPACAGLCVCITDSSVIFNPRTADPVLRKRLHGDMICVKQGFTKCSVCVVCSEAIITADNGIAAKAAEAGMDVLRILPGMIELEGFDTGFIGGASFLLDDRTMAFTGTLDRHADRDRILLFLEKYGVKPVFLTDRPLFDIGGAVALP